MTRIQTSEPGSHVPEVVANFQEAVDDFILLVKTLNTGKTVEEDFDLMKQINTNEIKSTVTSKTFERSGSRNAPNQQMISYGRDVHEESRPEICSISDQVISTSCDTVCVTPDSRTHASSISDQIVSYQSHSTAVSPEYFIIEKPFPRNQNSCAIKFKPTTTQNESMQINHFLGNERNLNFTENTACNMNVSEKANTEREIADTEDFKAKCLFSVGSADATCEDIRQSKSCMEKIKSGSPLKLQTIEMAHMKSQNTNFLVSYYITKFYCAVCNVGYSDTGSHVRNQTCDVCKKTFQCKVQLEDHYSTHETFHDTYCRICHFEIDKHETITGKRKYLCCQCGRTCTSRWILRKHLYFHSPLKLFKCELCGRRFKRIACVKRHFTKMHPLCEICEKRFVNNNYLDEHRLEQH